MILSRTGALLLEAIYDHYWLLEYSTGVAVFSTAYTCACTDSNDLGRCLRFWNIRHFRTDGAGLCITSILWAVVISTA